MKYIAKTIVLVVVSLLPAHAHAQSCSAVISQMVANWQNSGLKTRVTVLSHQKNGIRAFSGARPPVDGAPDYEARLVWNGSWMTNLATGGTPGLMQFVDRFNTTVGNDQNFSVHPPHMEGVDFYLSASYLVIHNRVWGNYLWIPNPQCSNGVMWGLGDPIGNANGQNKALYVFSYSFSQ